VCIGEKEGDLLFEEMWCEEEILGVGVRIINWIEVEKIDWIGFLGMCVLSYRDCSAARSGCRVALSYSTRG
jgi:hypothetical protein